MKKKTYKIIICVSLIVMLFTSFTSVFGATNDYYTQYTQVSENALDSKIKSSVLLDALANMINALGSLIEYLTGSIFFALTGDNIFPWADRIIFNGIAFLDINFLNPADNSLFVKDGTTSILGKVVKNVYSTIFSLSVLFLGVAVGIMAIRLAISSIATEKAKYKQAIVNWATCLVMLFLMHYILAFVFWVNEQLVSVASGILIKAIQDNNLTTTNFKDALDSVISSEERVQNFLSTSTWFSVDRNMNNSQENSTLTSNHQVASALITNEDYITNRVRYIRDSGKDFWGEFFSGIGEEDIMVSDIGIPRLEYDVKDAAAIKQLMSDDTAAVRQAKDRGYYTVNDHNIYITEEAYYKSDTYVSDCATALYLSNHTSARDVYTYYKSNPGLKIKDPDSPNLWSNWASTATSVAFPISNLITVTSTTSYETYYNTLKNIRDNQRC